MNENNNNQMNGSVLGTINQSDNQSTQVPLTTPLQPESNTIVQSTPVVQGTVQAPQLEMSAPAQSEPVVAQPVAPVVQEPAQAPQLEMPTPAQSEPVVAQPVAPVVQEQVQAPQLEMPTPAQPEPVVAQPVAQPIPGTENLNLEDAKKINANGFLNTQKSENIGAIPPAQSNKQPKGTNKIVFIVLIVVLIGALAFGVYYFLSVSNKVTLTFKTVTIGVGNSISDNLDDYVTITKGDKTKCNLNVSNVDSNKIGKYDISVTCGKEVYTGKVIVSDLTPPQLSVNTVFKYKDDEVNLDDFVAGCEDTSGCETSFSDKDSLDSNKLNPGGPYEVPINAIDSLGNEITKNGTLYVTDSKILVFTKCTISESIEGELVTKTVEDILPIGQGKTGLSYLGVSRRIYNFKFDNKETYESLVADKLDTMTYDIASGIASYDDENMILTISEDLPLTKLNEENGGEFKSNYADFRSAYIEKGYTCSNLAPDKITIK